MIQMRPIHPGEILIRDIVEEHCSITLDIALRLARFFSTTPQFWMNLQTSYDLKIVMRDIGSRIEQEVLQRAA